MINEKVKHFLTTFVKRVDCALPALLLLVLILFIISLFMPLMAVKSWWVFHSKISIISALHSLLLEGWYFIFIIIALFSVVVPILKIFSMLILWSLGSVDSRGRRLLLSIMSVLGKWAMLDVFVLALLVVIIKVNSHSQAKPLLGLYVFTVTIFFMIIISYRLHYLLSKDFKKDHS